MLSRMHTSFLVDAATRKIVSNYGACTWQFKAVRGCTSALPWSFLQNMQARLLLLVWRQMIVVACPKKGSSNGDENNGKDIPQVTMFVNATNPKPHCRSVGAFTEASTFGNSSFWPFAQFQLMPGVDVKKGLRLQAKTDYVTILWYHVAKWTRLMTSLALSRTASLNLWLLVLGGPTASWRSCACDLIGELPPSWVRHDLLLLKWKHHSRFCASQQVQFTE